MEHAFLVAHMRIQALKLMVIFSIVACGFFGIFNYVKSNAGIFDVRTDISNKGSIKPDDNISIAFYGYINTEKTLSALKISPKADFSYEWVENGKVLQISPISPWKNGQLYEVSIEDGKGMLGNSFNFKGFFAVENFPEVVSISPTSGEKNVVVDIEDPIVVNFDRSLKDYDVNVMFNPMGDFSIETDDQKKTIKIMPDKDLEQGKRYDMSIGIRHKNASQEDSYEKIFGSYFETKKMEIKEWSEDVSVRLFQAKNYTEPRIVSGKYIDINLKSQVMTIFEDGKAIDSFLISSGKRGMDTPEGEFQIHNKYPRPWSKKYSLYMPYWMAITSSGEFGIHELPEWPGGYKEGANHLGIPVSHGCVRLGIGPAERVYNWANVGTPVVIHK